MVWTASPIDAQVVRGSVVVVQLTARIDEGWHLYSISQGPGGPIRTQITVAPGQPFALADTVGGPIVTKRFDPNFGMSVETYDAHATFRVPVRVAATAPPGPAHLALTARFQTCNATLCLPPHTEKLSLPLTISAAIVRPLSPRSS